MKILVLSFYFRPDLSAGSFRATALVDSLCKLAPAGSHIDVITTLPNRYHSFAADAPQVEEQAALSIFRIPLPKHQSGMLDQSAAFLTFWRGAMRQTSDRDYDVVFATSGRLMTAVLGAFISRRKNAALYLDIRDIFALTITDVLPRKISWVVKPVFSALEKWTITQADKVNLVSAGFSEYFSARYPEQRFSFHTNGVDDAFLTVASSRPSVPGAVNTNRPLKVLYAGNVGESQGLHAIVPELSKRMGARIHFTIIGDGSRRGALETALSKNGVTNVQLLPPVKRCELLEQYGVADVLFLHLNDHPVFKTVLPSKLFEYAALGKPVWAGVSGYPAAFVRTEISNATVFHPCDVEGAVRAFEALTIQDNPRPDFVAKYSRATISRKMAADILALARADD